MELETYFKEINNYVDEFIASKSKTYDSNCFLQKAYEVLKEMKEIKKRPRQWTQSNKLNLSIPETRRKLNGNTL